MIINKKKGLNQYSIEGLTLGRLIAIRSVFDYAKVHNILTSTAVEFKFDFDNQFDNNEDLNLYRRTI